MIKVFEFIDGLFYILEGDILQKEFYKRHYIFIEYKKCIWNIDDIYDIFYDLILKDEVNKDF